MKVHLPSYARGVHQIHETITAEDLDLDPALFLAPIDIHVTLDRHDPYLEFNIRLQTEVTSTCDRCLVDYTWNLSGATPMFYVLGRLPSGETVDDPDIGYIPANATDIDLTHELRDLIILGLPGKYLCREDCRGLCPGCGVDLNLQDCTCGLPHHQSL